MGLERRARCWRSVAEKRRIVELTLEPGASVAAVAPAEGVNANQVFRWRRSFERGDLVELASSPALLPVRVSREPMQGPGIQPSACGSIHIELAGRAVISVESGADPVLLRAVLETFSK